MTEKKKLTLSKKLSSDVLKKAQSRFDQNRSNTVTFDVKSKKYYGNASHKQDSSNSEKLTDRELSKRMDALKNLIEERKISEQKQAEKEIVEEKNKKLLESVDVKEDIKSKTQPLPEAEKGKKSAKEIKNDENKESSLKSQKAKSSSKVKKTEKISDQPKKNAQPQKTSSKVAKTQQNSSSSDKQKIDSGTMRRQGRIAMSSAIEERREHLKDLAEKESSKRHLKDYKKGKNANAFVVREVEVGEVITVQDLANQMAVKSVDVVKTLMNLGLNVTINQSIDFETAEIVISEFGHKMKRTSNVQLKEEILEMKSDSDSDKLVARSPVVTVMGHVDHGKTSLLDAFRKTDVASHESGGITQQIGAYQVTLKNGKKITFIDTPGHEAFSAMRARGANTTDIVIIVVAADDGVKQQTIEAINHAKAANAPIIIAVNKIDKQDANPNKVRDELLQYGIAVEGFGGDVLSVDISAKKGIGIDKLEELILLQAEILDLKANPQRNAEGVVIESRQKIGLGTIASVLVQKGTLRKGDFFVSGRVFGKVRSLINDKGEQLKEAYPSMPVEVIGFDKSPLPGDDFIVIQDEAKAKEISNFRDIKYRESLNAVSAKKIQENILSKIENKDVKELNIILKADMQGSIEAIKHSILKFSNDEVTVQVIHSGIGEITENDIILAKASNAIIIGFNVRSNTKVREKAKSESINMSYYSIIYDVIDKIRGYVEGLLSPDVVEEVLGTAEVRMIFNITKVGKVAGCMVTDGLIQRNSKYRLLRDNAVVASGNIKSIRKVKEDVKEVKAGYECGISLDNYQDIKVGDVIESFIRKEIARKLKD